MSNENVSTSAEALKRCPVCKTSKPVTEYRRNPDSPDGLRNQCKACQTVAKRRRRAERAGLKCCRKCRKWKPYGEYWRRVDSPDGLQRHCKECIRWARYRRRVERAGGVWVDRRGTGD